jgi:hypothetical protein
VQRRPIRDLIDPRLERPVGAIALGERRAAKRFSRSQPATMVWNGADYLVECRDISYVGMGLVIYSPCNQCPQPGEAVRIVVKQGDSLYEDEFTVVQIEPEGTGTLMHLKL